MQLKIRNLFQVSEGIDSWNGHFLLDVGTEGAQRVPSPFTLDRNDKTKVEADSCVVLASVVGTDQLNSCFL